jgi:hypothetical protein
VGVQSRVVTGSTWLGNQNKGVVVQEVLIGLFPGSSYHMWREVAGLWSRRAGSGGSGRAWL